MGDLLKRRWLVALTALLSLCMGFSELYTYRIGWHPSSVFWKDKALLHLGDIPEILVLSVATFGILMLLYKKLVAVPVLKENTLLQRSPTDPPFAIIAAILLLAWFPFFLAFYPGTGMNDTTDIMRSGIWATGQHTFLYCAFIDGFTEISFQLFGTASYGIAATSLVQMVLLALAISYTVTWIYRQTGRLWITAVLTCYYAFTPIIINMSFSNVKDVLFSASILLWIPLVTSFVSGYHENAWKSNKTLFVLAGLGMMLLRNNGPYVFIVMLVCLLIMMKHIRKDLLATGVIMIAIAMTPDIAIKEILNLPQLFQERVGIPLQQVSRTVTQKDTVLTPKEENYINRIMGTKTMAFWYDPFTVDNIKWNSAFDFYYFNAHPEEFWPVWKSLALRYPETYVEAWLFATYGYWSFPAPDGETQSRFGWAFTDTDLKQGMSPDHNNNYQSATIHQFFPKNVQEKLGQYLWNHSRYLGAGTCIWIVLSIGILLLYRKQYGRALVLLPACLIWGTLLIATPAAFVYRYVYCFPLCMPLFFLLPFLPEGKYADTKWEDTVFIDRDDLKKEENDEIAHDDGYTHWSD